MGALRPLRPRRVSLHALCLAIARRPGVVRFSRSLVRGLPHRGRLSRLAAVFHFVGCLIDAAAAKGDLEDGVDGLLCLMGHERGPAVILASLLLALGERAELVCTREMAFVRVEVPLEELRRVPPYARVFHRGGRYYIPLDPRRSRSPLGFLPIPVREVLARRGGGAHSGPSRRSSSTYQSS